MENKNDQSSLVKLKKSDEHLRKYFELGLVGMAITSLEKHWLEFNDTLCEMLGYSREDFANKTWVELTHPEDILSDVAQFNRILSGESDGYSMEKRFIHSDGSIVHAAIAVNTIRDSNGLIDHFVAFVSDITVRKLAEERASLYSKIFSDTNEGITITDGNNIIIDVNPAFCEVTGYRRDEVIGKNPRILSSGKQSPKFYENMWQEIKKQSYWQGEMWNRKKSGEIFAELVNISVLKDENGKTMNYVAIFMDITSSKQQQRQIKLMAHYDVLTGLPNRALFVDRFTQAVSHSKRTDQQLAVCIIDLDNFKPINDNYGHQVGDKLLIKVANRIKSNIREGDTLSRQDGDEFLLLMTNVDDYKSFIETIERVHNSITEPYKVAGRVINVNASSGMTIYPDDDGDIDTLLRHAGRSLYQAKLEGKNRYHLFNKEYDQLTIEKYHQLSEIERALDSDEFELYYQPKVNMVSGKVFGAEALIRWIHPTKGLIPPLDFLPAIEGEEIEIKIGNWVVSQAIEQLDQWHKQNINIEISVNIASNHLVSETFFSELDTALAKHPSVDSEYLQLEILESSALNDLKTISDIIETCKNKLGINAALDDFGTGYSSLTHLRSLPIDVIKIDQSFVRDILDDPNDYAMVESVVGLTRTFEKYSIAEGVETIDHGLMLTLIGCNVAQGFGIAKPMPTDQFLEWLSCYAPNEEWLNSRTKYPSKKEKQVKLFRLVSNRWKDLFINKIRSEPGELKSWPLMDSKYCSCGAWIKRVEQEQLFEPKNLNQLREAHKATHLTAQALHDQYFASDFDGALKRLPDFQTAFDKMNNALALC